jgi:hypothetical protein
MKYTCKRDEKTGRLRAWKKKEIEEYERKEAFNIALIEWTLCAVILCCILSYFV